jgi:hypothetical protein
MLIVSDSAEHPYHQVFRYSLYYLKSRAHLFRIAWEEKYEKVVNEPRKAELKKLRVRYIFLTLACNVSLLYGGTTITFAAIIWSSLRALITIVTYHV